MTDRRCDPLSGSGIDGGSSVRTIRGGAHALDVVDLGGDIGLWHPAEGPVGVVVFGSWAYEDHCLRPALRELGDALAHAGLPTMRFDLPGVADSSAETLPSSLSAWIEAGGRAADVLRAVSGCRRLIFVGFGLGAVVATRTAMRRDDVVGWCLAGPVQKGRRYVRETATAARLMYDAAGLPAPRRDGLDISGEFMPGTLVAEIEGFDLRAEVEGGGPTVSRVQILERPGDGADAGLVERLRAGGADVEVRPFGDHHRTTNTGIGVGLPTETIGRIVDWAASTSATVDRAIDPPRRRREARVAVEGNGFVEEPVGVGSAGDLYGVRCRPSGGDGRGPIVVLFNTNHLHHGGWGRVWVEIARGLARAGHGSVRFDLPGIGDSPPRPDGPDIIVYSDHHIEAAVDVVETLSRAEGRDVVVVGVCSGAYLAFQVAVRSQAVAATVQFNTQRFVWDPKETVADAIRNAARPVSDYLGRIGRFGTYRRLIGGHIDVKTVLRNAVRAMVAGVVNSNVASFVLHHDRWVLHREVHRDFDLLRRRGTLVRLVNGEKDAAMLELAKHWGPGGRELAAHPTVQLVGIADVDHGMTPPRVRRSMEREILEVADAVAAHPRAALERTNRGGTR